MQTEKNLIILNGSVVQLTESAMAKKVSSDDPKVPPQPKAGRHPMSGALKDITFIPPGVDLTEPADPYWADISERKARDTDGV